MCLRGFVVECVFGCRCGSDEVHCGKRTSVSSHAVFLCFVRMSDSEDSDLEEGTDVMRHQTKIVSRIQMMGSGCAEHTHDSQFLSQIYQNQYPYIHMEPLGE